jgi:DHA3 family macrolide efflux protein-like MFS transporter
LNSDKDKIQILKGSLACFFGSFGSTFFSFGLGVMVLRQTGSPLSFGVTQLLGPILATISSPLILYLVQQRNLKKVIFFTQCTSIFTLVLFFFSTQYLGQFFYLQTIFVISILTLCDYIFGISYDSSVRQIVSIDSIQQLKTYEEMVGSVSLILSPLVGSVLIDMLPFQAFILVAMIFEIITALIVYSMSIGSYDLSIPKKEIIAKIKQNRELITKERSLVDLLALLFTTTVIFGSVNVGLPYLQINLLQFPSQNYGITKSFYAFGMFVSSIILVKKPKQSITVKNILYLSTLLGIGILTFGASIGLNGNRSAFFLLIVFNFSIAFIIVRFRTFYSTWTSIQLDSSVLPQFITYQRTLTQIATPLGYLIFGFLFSHISFTLVFSSAGFVLFLLGLFFLIKNCLK